MRAGVVRERYVCRGARRPLRASLTVDLSVLHHAAQLHMHIGLKARDHAQVRRAQLQDAKVVVGALVGLLSTCGVVPTS